MATPKVSRSWAAVAAPRLMACLICRSVTALHTHTYISNAHSRVSSGKNNSANKNHLQQFFGKNNMSKINELQKRGKKVRAGAARWEAGRVRDLPLRARGGGWRGAGAFGVNPGGVWRLSVRGA